MMSGIFRRAQRTIDSKRGEHGAAMLESALVLGMLLFCMLGIFDLGRAVYTYTGISQSAREGARRAVPIASRMTCVLDHATPEVIAAAPAPCKAAMQWANKTLNTDKLRVEVTYPPSSPPVVEVTVRYRFEAISLMIGQAIGNEGVLPLSSRSTMVLE